MKKGILALVLLLVAVALVGQANAQNRYINTQLGYDQYWSATGRNASNTFYGGTQGCSYPYGSGGFGIYFTTYGPRYFYNGKGRTSYALSQWMDTWVCSWGGYIRVGFTDINGATTAPNGECWSGSPVKFYVAARPGSGKADWDDRAVVKHEMGHVFYASDHETYWLNCIMNKHWTNTTLLTSANNRFCSSCATTISNNKRRGF